MSEPLIIYKAVKEITDHMEGNSERKVLREKINEVCRYTDKKGSFMMINSNISNFVRFKNEDDKYCVDPKQFYELIKAKFPKLKTYIPENYRRTEYTSYLGSCSSLDAYAPTPEFSTIEEAKVIIQEQADELRDEKKKVKELEKALDEANVIVNKWNTWNKNKGSRGNW